MADHTRDEAAPRQATRWGRPGSAPRVPSTTVCLLLLVGLCVLAYAGVDREMFHFDSRGWLDLMAIGRFEEPWQRVFSRPFVPNQALSEALLASNLTWNRAFGLESLDVTGFLVFNVALHAGVACLLFLLLAELLDRSGGGAPWWIPFAGAAAFSVHPLHISTVAYVIQRRGALVALFTLMGALAYLKLRTRVLGEGEGAGAIVSEASAAMRVALGCVVALCVWLAAHSKVMGLTMAISLLALEVCLAARNPQALRRSLRWVAAGGAVVAVGMAYFAVQRGLFDPSQGRFTAIGDQELWGTWPQFLTMARATALFQLLLALPLPSWSAIDHQLLLSRTLFDHGAFAALALHAAWLGAGIAALWRRRSLFALGVFWFYIPLAPYFVLPQADHFVEYKTYLPSVGVAILVVALLRVCWLRAERRTTPVVALTLRGAVAVAIALLFATTVGNHATYETEIALWGHAREAEPVNPRANYHLGLALAEANRVDEAMVYLKAAAQLAPSWPGPPGAIGYLLVERGQSDLAQRWYKRAIEVDPEEASARLGLAAILVEDGRAAAALPHLEVALVVPEHQGVRGHLKRGGGSARAHTLMGRALFQLGKPEAAIVHYREALAEHPEMAPTLLELGRALLQVSDASAAVEALRKAERLSADERDPDFHFALGDALLRVGLHEAGIARLRRALELRPGWAEAANNLAWHLALLPAPLGNISEALRLAKFAAARSGRRDPNVLDTLAAVLEAAGRPGEALGVIDEALSLLPTDTDSRLVRNLHQRRSVLVARGAAARRSDAGPAR